MKITLPTTFTDKMKRLLNDDYEQYIKSFNSKNYVGLRANTLKISPEDLKNKLPFELENVPWCPSGFYYDENIRPAKHPYYYAGLYYIQEPSAMSTGATIEINEGDRILDLCAAPGGKSTQVAAKLNGKGLLVSNDISTGRCKALLKNIELAGLSNAIVTNESPERLAERFPAYFNKIIVDAPCSGEGMFRKDSEAVKSWAIHKVEMCRQLQENILKSAATLVCDGGIIAYSTCTFDPLEDEGSINNFLKNNPDFELLEADKYDLFDKGNPQWINGGLQELTKCARLWPHKIKGEGHFLALLRRKCGNPFQDVEKIPQIKEKHLADFFAFQKEFTNLNYQENFEIHNSGLIAIPNGINLKGLRVVRSGLYLGELKTKRFEPSQAFAMSMKKENAKNTIDFSIKDENVLRYLKGESFEAIGNDGWNLVCVDSFPLGWGKIQKNRLKNKYLAGWKM